MGNGGAGEELSIGNALKEARQRAGLDIRTAEDRTKIRTRYLRALENEDWQVLPGHAYVKGFLRTYGQLLGLDADALVNEYRRAVEGPTASPVPLAGDVLQARRGDPGGPPRGPRWGLALGGLVAIVAVVLLVLGLTAGDDPGQDPADDRAERAEQQAREDARAERRRERQRRRRRAERREQRQQNTVRLRLIPRTDGITVCLVGDGNRPLIDGQTLSAGNDESYEARRFELRFPFGYDVDQLDLRVGGRRAELPELSGPAAFRIRPPRQVRQIDAPGTGCP